MSTQQQFSQFAKQRGGRIDCREGNAGVLNVNPDNQAAVANFDVWQFMSRCGKCKAGCDAYELGQITIKAFDELVEGEEE